jgi:ribosomal protein S27AE
MASKATTAIAWSCDRCGYERKTEDRNGFGALPAGWITAHAKRDGLLDGATVAIAERVVTGDYCPTCAEGIFKALERKTK